MGSLSAGAILMARGTLERVKGARTIRAKLTGASISLERCIKGASFHIGILERGCIGARWDLVS